MLSGTVRHLFEICRNKRSMNYLARSMAIFSINPHKTREWRSQRRMNRFINAVTGNGVLRAVWSSRLVGVSIRGLQEVLICLMWMRFCIVPESINFCAVLW